jgi:hypothetical protein
VARKRVRKIKAMRLEIRNHLNSVSPSPENHKPPDGKEIKAADLYQLIVCQLQRLSRAG